MVKYAFTIKAATQSGKKSLQILEAQKVLSREVGTMQSGNCSEWVVFVLGLEC